MLWAMEGLLPPNVSLHSTAPVSSEAGKKVQLHVGCSSEGDEIVVWMDIESGESRTLEHIFTTASSAAAATRFNEKLGELSSEGFAVDNEIEIDATLLDRARPNSTSPATKPTDKEDDDPRSGPSGLLYG